MIPSPVPPVVLCVVNCSLSQSVLLGPIYETRTPLTRTAPTAVVSQDGLRPHLRPSAIPSSLLSSYSLLNSLIHACGPGQNGGKGGQRQLSRKSENARKKNATSVKSLEAGVTKQGPKRAREKLGAVAQAVRQRQRHEKKREA